MNGCLAENRHTLMQDAEIQLRIDDASRATGSSKQARESDKRLLMSAMKTLESHCESADLTVKVVALEFEVDSASRAATYLMNIEVYERGSGALTHSTNQVRAILLGALQGIQSGVNIDTLQWKAIEMRFDGVLRLRGRKPRGTVRISSSRKPQRSNTTRSGNKRNFSTTEMVAAPHSSVSRVREREMGPLRKRATKKKSWLARIGAMIGLGGASASNEDAAIESDNASTEGERDATPPPPPMSKTDREIYERFKNKPGLFVY